MLQRYFLEDCLEGLFGSSTSQDFILLLGKNIYCLDSKQTMEDEDNQFICYSNFFINGFAFSQRNYHLKMKKVMQEIRLIENISSFHLKAHFLVKKLYFILAIQNYLYFNTNFRKEILHSINLLHMFFFK